MKKEYIETMDDLKRYLDSDEYKSMEREIMELVKKCEINQIKYDGFDPKIIKDKAIIFPYKIHDVITLTNEEYDFIKDFFDLKELKQGIYEIVERINK